MNGFARNKAQFRTLRECDRQIRIPPASLFPSQSSLRGGKGIQTPLSAPESQSRAADSVSLSAVAASCQWLWLVPASSVHAETLSAVLREEGEVPHMLCCSAPFSFSSSPLGISYQAAFYLTLAELQMHSAHRERRRIRERTFRKP